MLTFSFTGVDGSMTESEILTSGMVGKQVSILFDGSWDGLSKTMVFHAGEVTRVVIDPADELIIPADVLARPYVRLYVGVCGTDSDGAVVIPTVMAEGPMIRYGADPMEDETEEKLPVWKNLQNQIGDLSVLHTEDKTDLVSAVNELTTIDLAMIHRISSLETAQEFMGDSQALETAEKTTLVDAVNEIHNQVEELAQNCLGFNADAAQLLVDILSKGLYTSDQSARIDALCAMFGVEVSEDLSHLIHYWDFRTGSLTDRIGGLEAQASSDVTLDTDGAHIENNTSYIMFPTGADGASLAGHTAEIRFGEFQLDTSASTLRLLLISNGSQPASMGLQWTVQDCWSSKSSLVTEFTDINMFSGKKLLVKANSDASQFDWYCDDQLILSYTPSFTPTYLSIGSTANGAFPLTVEYVRIYPTV